MLFFDDDAPALNDPLPFGQLGRLGLPYETYKLALDRRPARRGLRSTSSTPDVRGTGSADADRQRLPERRDAGRALSLRHRD